MNQQPRLIDLSHPIETGMPAYPGLPSPRIEPHITHTASRATYGGQAEFTITRAFLVGNTGTYLDSPWHRHVDGPDIAMLPLERMAALPGVRAGAAANADLPAMRAIELGLSGVELAGCAVLVRTGWDRRWGTDAYWEPGPYLSASAVDLLIEAGVALVGVDFGNVDDTSDPARPAHTRLLGADIPIVEHLRGLEQLPAAGFRFYAVPPPIRGAGSFPVRAFARIEAD